jgi:hypothetical protein
MGEWEEKRLKSLVVRDNCSFSGSGVKGTVL